MRLFAYKTEYHLACKSYEALSLVFPEKGIPSVKSVKSRAQFLAGFEPRKYDCCISSCCAFTGPNAELDKCSYCDEPRFAAGGQPQKQFTYISLIPRLVAFYHNRELAEKMCYWAEYQHDPEVIRDVMDSEHYRRLCSEYVHVDGQQLGHRHFSDCCDIALVHQRMGLHHFAGANRLAGLSFFSIMISLLRYAFSLNLSSALVLYRALRSLTILIPSSGLLWKNFCSSLWEFLPLMHQQGMHSC